MRLVYLQPVCQCALLNPPPPQHQGCTPCNCSAPPMCAFEDPEALGPVVISSSEFHGAGNACMPASAGDRTTRRQCCCNRKP